MDTITPLLEALRGQRHSRPSLDLTLAGGLRSWLEDDLAPLVADLSLSSPLLLSPRTVVDSSLSAVPNISAIARAALVTSLLMHEVFLGAVTHPMDDALSALEADPGREELVEAIHGLEPDAFAQLAAEVTAHHSVLARHVGMIPSTWLPRVASRLSVNLAGGRVLLGASPSLLLGPPSFEVASVCLLEVTTSPLDEHTEKRLSVFALLELLRSGATPLRVGSLSTSTGETLVCTVNDGLLTAALHLVTAAVARRTISE
jgi:hypothetical protein